MKWRRTNKYLPSGKRVSNTFNQTAPPELYRLGNARDQMRCACVTGPDGQMCKRACTLNGCKSWTGTFGTLVPTGTTGTFEVPGPSGTHVAKLGTGTILIRGPTGTQLRTCKGTPYRNPIAGYRKERICDCCVCSWATVWTGTQQVENTTCPHGMPCPTGSVPTNTIYKDNYAKTCASLKYGPLGPERRSACYDPVIKVQQNKNGQIDEQYNYNSKQYLERRCRGYRQKVFNFQGHIGGCCSKKYKGSCSQCSGSTTVSRSFQLLVGESLAILGSGTYGWVSPTYAAGADAAGEIEPSTFERIPIYLLGSIDLPPFDTGFGLILEGTHDESLISQLTICTTDGTEIATLNVGNYGTWPSSFLPPGFSPSGTLVVGSAWIWGASVTPPDLSPYNTMTLRITIKGNSEAAPSNCYSCEYSQCGVTGCNKCYKMTDVKKSDCCVTWAPSNRPFNQQGAVSGGSRINRLKYNTVARSQQACKPKMYKHGNCGQSQVRTNTPEENLHILKNQPAFKNSVNGMIPLRYYRDARPVYKSNLAGLCPVNDGSNCRGRPQRCSRTSLIGGHLVPQKPTTLCKHGCPQWRSKGGSAVRRRVIGSSW